MPAAARSSTVTTPKFRLNVRKLLPLSLHRAPTSSRIPPPPVFVAAGGAASPEAGLVMPTYALPVSLTWLCSEFDGNDGGGGFPKSVAHFEGSHLNITGFAEFPGHVDIAPDLSSEFIDFSSVFSIGSVPGFRVVGFDRGDPEAGDGSCSS